MQEGGGVNVREGQISPSIQNQIAPNKSNRLVLSTIKFTQYIDSIESWV